MADLITLIEGAALAKFVGPAAEHYGKVALERAQQIGNKAISYLAAVGREPQPVEPKILLPLVQAASLETDEALANRWASLLANAADSLQRAAVQPAYIDLLRPLTPTDARVLDYIYHNRQPITPNSGVEELVIRATQLITDLEMPLIELGVSIDNLQRLWLCVRPNTWGGSVSLNTGDEDYALLPTILGQAFYDAVTPPTS
jgi:hypothetical protein